MGLDVGMRNGGIDALLACEFNKACRMTIEKNNPNIGLIGDITKFSAAEILKMAKVPEGRKVDIILVGRRAKLLVLQEIERLLMMREEMCS